MSEEEFKNFILYCSTVVTCITLCPEDIGSICERVLEAEISRLIFMKKNNLDDKIWKN
jgi:hypothetical protein